MAAVSSQSEHRGHYSASYTGSMDQDQEVPKAAVAVLLDNHRAFLRYLERRVGDRALAEDILQDAFTRNIDKFEAVVEEAVVPWFYRTLRNATIDQYRRRAPAIGRSRPLPKSSRRMNRGAPQVEAEICACVTRLAQTLKPEYAEVLQAGDVGGKTREMYAEEKGLSASNAGVRAFRARKALRKHVMQSYGTCAEHGYLNCTCAAKCTSSAESA